MVGRLGKAGRSRGGEENTVDRDGGLEKARPPVMLDDNVAVLVLVNDAGVVANLDLRVAVNINDDRARCERATDEALGEARRLNVSTTDCRAQRLLERLHLLDVLERRSPRADARCEGAFAHLCDRFGLGDQQQLLVAARGILGRIGACYEGVREDGVAKRHRGELLRLQENAEWFPLPSSTKGATTSPRSITGALARAVVTEPMMPDVMSTSKCAKGGESRQAARATRQRARLTRKRERASLATQISKT